MTASPPASWSRFSRLQMLLTGTCRLSTCRMGAVTEWYNKIRYLSEHPHEINKQTLAGQQSRVLRSTVDCETFCTSLLMPQRTIRIPYRTREGVGLRHFDGVAVEQKFNTEWSGENAEFTSWIAVLDRSVNHRCKKRSNKNLKNVKT